MNIELLTAGIGKVWDESILERLSAYIRIPNKSPMFDAQWEQHGHMEAAITLMAQWCQAQPLPGMRVQVRRLPGRTPLLFVDVPGELPGCVLLYGHLDKQPEFTGWLPGLGPWTPVLRDGKLYGRGGADDGYAVFAAVSAVRAVEQQKAKHSRIVIIIECCEESGSTDLPAYIKLLNKRIGTPSLVICLDSGCGNYDQLWMTTSLRGAIVGNLTVEVLTEGVHSGDSSGIVPSSFRILRILLDRVDDSRTGKLRDPVFQVPIPPDRLEQ